MKALVLKRVGKIVLEEVKDPVIRDSKDVIVKITMSAICGTDLHLVRGTVPGVLPNTILGHEGVGVVESVGSDVKDFAVGDRVIVPSTIGCGQCSYCKRGLYSQCDVANPLGPKAGTAFYGGPITAGGFNGMQAEKVRVPFADANLVKIPDSLQDEQVILLSDILPTSFMAVENAHVQKKDTIAVFGCGPVGQLAIACLKKKGVKKIFAIDSVPCRLKMAHDQGGVHVINFDDEDPVKELKRLTDNQGPTKIIDAVGIDAERPDYHGWYWLMHLKTIRRFNKQVKHVAPIRSPHGDNWIPGDAPSQVLEWAVAAVAKAGTISIIGVYTPLLHTFDIGAAMQKNLTITMGNCNHRLYLPKLLDAVAKGQINLVPFISHMLPFNEVVSAYKHFDRRDDGWIKVALKV